MTYSTAVRVACAVAVAALLTGAAECDTGEGPVKKGSDEAKRRYNAGDHPGAVRTVKPSCPDEQPANGVTGTVDGGMYTEPDALTCLEIKTPGGRIVTIRVPGEAYDQCQQDDPYPACARR